MSRVVSFGGKEVVFAENGESKRRTVSKATLWRAFRAKCLECIGSAPLVKECDGELLDDERCNLWPYRFGLATKVQNEQGKMRPEFRKGSMLKAIKRECTYCLGENKPEICTSPNCQLFPFRGGKVRVADGFGQNGEALCDFPTSETISRSGKGGRCGERGSAVRMRYG